MIVDPGTGGSISTDVLENYCYQLVQRLHLIESNPSKNPNTANYITSSTDDETFICSGSIEIPCRMLKNEAGQTLYNYNHPYVSTGFTPATDSTIKGQNIVECIVSAFLTLTLAELDPDQNPDNIRNISSFDHNISSIFDPAYTAILTINFSIPTVITQTADGTVIKGKAYL